MLIRGLNGFDACLGGILSIGNFDGVHRGHQLIIQTLIQQARAQNLPAIVFTFDPHPIDLLRPEFAPPELMGIEERAAILQSLGVDFVIAYPTDHALLSLSPEEFFQQVLIDQLKAKGLVEGPNFYFGKDRSGDVSLLQQLCARADLSFEVVEPDVCDGRMISSSEVRNAIQSGNLTLATEMLGRLYQVNGRVIHGEERGRLLGFPTANLSEVSTLLPGEGVYCGFGIVGEDRYPAAIHIGTNPTFEKSEKKVEVYLIGFSEEIYDQNLKVEFLEKLRETETFSDVETLKSQLAIDVETAKKQAHQWKPAQ
ncbi:bifunctional riboflavin kinase/FAD synthetase [Gimesia aquarii]|uniref:Riboflavin biosynthesis protein n=1 Tax=Gimesia aquarii TaxID=2527964 RepID=A0A517VYC4_9PLAN|nr:bifunctional riboflavin kinase/FAD synthetase [Gimesia aquarii]QDT98003.1 Riboflavin kinase [Gimesia aquarii]